MGGLCEECWKHGISTPGVQVHHKIKLTPKNMNDPAIALNFDNLELLCRDCHEKKHRERTGRRFMFDENGDMTIR